MIEEPGAPPYFSWLLALRSCIQQCDDEALIADLGSGAEDVADVVPELRERLQLETTRTATDSAAARFQLYDSVTRFLLRIAARQPLILLFDNLHSADRSSLTMLEYLCQQIAGSPILVIGAYRESELDRRHPLRTALNRLSRNTGYLRLVLTGLSREEVAQLLHAKLGHTPPASVVDSVYEQSDGNPLFVTEVGSMLARRQSDLQITSAGHHFKVPESLRDVIGARLDALPADTIALLRVAAVLGREFDVSMVAQLASVPPRRVVTLLHDAEEAAIVASFRPGRFRFHHILFREVLYEEHNTISRVMLHRCAGEQLEKRLDDDLNPNLSEIAYHYFEAAQAGKAEKAIHFCQQAADAAVRQRAYGEAVALLDCALQVSELEEDKNQERRFELLRAMGRAQYQSGDLSDATRTLMKAAILAYQQHWWNQLGEALYLFQLICQQSGFRHVASIPLHKVVLEQLPATNSILRARVLASLAKAYRTAAEPDLAAESFKKSIVLARQCDDPVVLLDCLRKGNWTVGRNPGTVREGLQIAREALELATAQHDSEAALDSVVDIVFQLCDLGEIDEVRQQLTVLKRLAIEERLPHFRSVLTGFETALAILCGKWSDAIRGAKDGVRQLPLKGVKGLQGRFAFQIFAIRKAQGSLGPLQDVVDRIIEENRESNFWLPGQVLLHCELGQMKLARDVLQKFGNLRELPKDDLFEIALVYLAEACTKLGDSHRCADLYELLAPYRGLNATLPGTFMLGAVSGYLANLAVATRQLAEARTLFEEALVMNESMGALPALARTQVDFTRMLLGTEREEDRVRARRLIAESRPVAQELELRPILLAIADLDAAAGASSLTGREIDVLKNIATGLSNNNIADTLHISHSTVATHVRNIFRKISVANRTEAADFARRSGLLDHE